MSTRTVRIEKMVYGGAGVGVSIDDAGGRPVYVPFTLMGEEVSLAADSDADEGVVDSILKSSVERVAPACQHFGSCGGCQYQHADYSEQLRIKETILRTMLERNRVAAPETIAVHAGQPLEYRNRIRLRLQKMPQGWRAGYSERSSNRFLAVNECPIAVPLLWRAAQALLACSIPVQAREVELFCDGEEHALQMTLHLDATIATMERESAAQFRTLCDQMAAQLSQLKGAGLAVLKDEVKRGTGDPAKVRRESVEVAAWGESALLCRLALNDRIYTHNIRRGSFFQVNRFLLSTLLQIVVADRSGETAWDLFAGAGFFTQPLASCFNHVVAVEVAERASETLSAFAKAAGQTAYRETALGFLRAETARHSATPDLIVVDPPRAGLGEEVCRLLSLSEAKEIVYVSCDPETLSRDLRRLLESGYRLAELHLVDLFPQTYHLETVAILHR